METYAFYENFKFFKFKILNEQRINGSYNKTKFFFSNNYFFV